MSSQKLDSSEQVSENHGKENSEDGYHTSYREQLLLSALDQSLIENTPGGMSSDRLSQLQQRRQAVLHPVTDGSTSWWQGIWKSLEGIQSRWLPGAVVVGGGMFGVLALLALNTQPSNTQDIGISLAADSAQVTEKSLEQVESRVKIARLDDWILLTSVSEQDWELVLNAEFIAWLEEQSVGGEGADRSG